MIDTRALKDEIPMYDVLDEIGAKMYSPVPLAQQVGVWCPFCHDRDSEHPGASINTLKDLYYCFVCGFGGDIITVAMEYNHQSFEDACKWLTANFLER